MPANAAQPLIDLKPTREFLIGIDSDGCVFDTMEIKHKQCFIPNTIRCFGLEPIADAARQSAEFVNLYSKWRGINRFPALIMTLDLLGNHPDSIKAGVSIPTLPATRAWIEQETMPANPALKTAIQSTTGPEKQELQQVLGWSEAVNETVAQQVQNVPPFTHVRECLQRAARHADIIVVSATPEEALHREWQEHGLAQYVKVIAGQEMGTKREHLRLATRDRYSPNQVLMIGDAPGDMKAALDNEALFFPVHPGAEQQSWQRLSEEGLDRFLEGRYAGTYHAERITAFEALLPSTPPWKLGE